jgi:HK97 family phage prohead protease
MTVQQTSGLAPELKYIALDLSDVATDGIFEGYASLFHREDLARDVMLPGAFRASLAARGHSGIRMLFQHDPNQPIGVWESIEEDRRGLKVRGRLTLDVEKAREVFSLMKVGAIDGLSIGFKPTRFKRDRRTGVRRLESVDLWEISIVTFPMQPGARIAEIKTWPFAGQVPSERQFERWLTRDAGLARSEARALMRNGLKGLMALRDAGEAEDEVGDVRRSLRRAIARLKSAT